MELSGSCFYGGFPQEETLLCAGEEPASSQITASVCVRVFVRERESGVWVGGYPHVVRAAGKDPAFH